MLCPCKSHSPNPVPSEESTEPQVSPSPQRQASLAGKVGRPAHSSCLPMSSSPGALGYQRIEHVEHKGHQSCHGAQNKVSETALVWCGRAITGGGPPSLGAPRDPEAQASGTGSSSASSSCQIREAYGVRKRPSAPRAGERGGRPSVPETPGHNSPTQGNWR